jgi:hypothetical protein
MSGYFNGRRVGRKVGGRKGERGGGGVDHDLLCSDIVAEGRGVYVLAQ